MQLAENTDSKVYGTLMRSGITLLGGKVPPLRLREVPVKTFQPAEGRLKSINAPAGAFLTE